MATIDESDYEQACLASHIVCDRTGLRSRNETRSSWSVQDEHDSSTQERKSNWREESWRIDWTMSSKAVMKYSKSFEH